MELVQVTNEYLAGYQGGRVLLDTGNAQPPLVFGGDVIFLHVEDDTVFVGAQFDVLLEGTMYEAMSGAGGWKQMRGEIRFQLSTNASLDEVNRYLSFLPSVTSDLGVAACLWPKRS